MINGKITAVIICVFAVLALILFACESSDGKDCTVTFSLGYATSKAPPPSITVKSGSAAGSLFPQNPSRTAWNFQGWRGKDKKVYTQDTVITGNVSLTANWSFIRGIENPIIRDRFTTDPAPFYDEDSDTLYIVAGEDALPPNAPSNEYFRMPRWNMYKTTDMKTFEFVGQILQSENFPNSSSNTAWAAQLIKGLDGKYYFYVTTHRSPNAWPYQICVATAVSVEGPYTPHSSVLITESMVSSDIGNIDNNRNIDPTVFIDDDGSAYIVWAQVNPRVAKLKSNMVEIERPIKKLFQNGWKMTDPSQQYEEGPWLYKRNGKYYLFFASMRKNDAGANIAENISYAMADSMEGPWTDGEVISGYAPGAGWQGNSFTIHPGVVDFKGLTYMFYHSQVMQLDIESNGVLWTGRNVCVDYLYFDRNGKPQFINVRIPDGLSKPPRDD